MKNISKLYNKFNSLIEMLLGVFVTLMIGIVFLQVLFRYVFKLSLAGAEELPRYFMIICVYLGSILLVKTESHVKIDMITLFIKNKNALKIIEIIVNFICMVTMIYFSYVSLDYIKFIYDSGDKTAGLGLPLWSIMSFLFIGGSLMSLNFFINMVKKCKELR